MTVAGTSVAFGADGPLATAIPDNPIIIVKDDSSRRARSPWQVLISLPPTDVMVTQTARVIHALSAPFSFRLTPVHTIRSYCVVTTATHPLALCVVQMVPACMGTKAWFVLGSTEMLCEFVFVGKFTSH